MTLIYKQSTQDELVLHSLTNISEVFFKDIFSANETKITRITYTNPL